MGMNYQLANVPATAEALIGKQVAVSGNMDSSAGAGISSVRISSKKSWSFKSADYRREGEAGCTVERCETLRSRRPFTSAADVGAHVERAERPQTAAGSGSEAGDRCPSFPET